MGGREESYHPFFSVRASDFDLPRPVGGRGGEEEEEERGGKEEEEEEEGGGGGGVGVDLSGPVLRSLL